VPGVIADSIASAIAGVIAGAIADATVGVGVTPGVESYRGLAASAPAGVTATRDGTNEVMRRVCG